MFQQNVVDNYQIYTSKGWSNIKRVIRHKTRKNIYRVTTHTGMVDVTEDHSLLDENGKIIKPTEVKCGMKLLHNYMKTKYDILCEIVAITELLLSIKITLIYVV